MEIVSGHNGPTPKMAHVYCPKREGLPASRDGQELPSETRRTSRAASGCSKKGSSRRPRSCAAASHAASHLGHTQPRLERVGRVGRPWLRGLAAHGGCRKRKVQTAERQRDMQAEQTSSHRRTSDASCWSHMGCALRGAGGLGSHAACSRSVKTMPSQHGEDFRSGSANFGRPDPATLGGPQEPSQAYSDSKACDVALALAWGRRRPGVASAAVDPGWVKTKLASAGAPGDVTSSADTLAYCSTEADLASAPYWKDRAATSVPRHLKDEALQDAIASACDRLATID
jgi:hypothetical protein